MDDKATEVEVIGSVHLVRDTKTGDFYTTTTKGGDDISGRLGRTPVERLDPVNGTEYHYLQDRISGKQG